MNNKFPEKLYHYCSISTFMSIIKNKCFWLSDTKYTNDKEELAAFRISVYETLSELLRDNIIDNKMAEDYGYHIFIIHYLVIFHVFLKMEIC